MIICNFIVAYACKIVLGFGKSPGYTTVAWGGDQNVDFSYGDGLMSVIPGALSMGMSGTRLKIKQRYCILLQLIFNIGMGVHHSDVGGYLSLICMVRTEELVLRWAEMNAFTPILRTHEGNRPYRNWQVQHRVNTAEYGIDLVFPKLFV